MSARLSAGITQLHYFLATPCFLLFNGMSKGRVALDSAVKNKG